MPATPARFCMRLCCVLIVGQRPQEALLSDC
jgi:hypothetical protein